MALKLGELSAVIKADDAPMEEGLDKARGKFQQFGDRLGGMATAAGAAAALALGIAIAGALELDKAQAKLSAQMGLTAEQSKAYGEIAGNLYKEGFGQSIAELGQTVRAVIQGGLIDRNAATADIEAVARSAQTLADVFDIDVVQAARAAGQMVETGLAKNATEAMDILTAAFRETGDQAGDLLDTFSEYAVQFQAIGLSGAQGMGLMAQATKAGARDLDTVADGMKEFAIQSKSGNKEAADSFKALGFNAERMQAIFAKGGPGAAAAFEQVLDAIRRTAGQSNSAATQFGLFGTKSEDLQKALMAMDPASAVAALGKVEGATKAAGDALGDSAAAKLESFKRKAQEALVQKLGEAVPTLEKVAGWIERNSGFVGGLVTGLTGLVLVIGTILGIYKVWIILQTALNIVMMLNPIGLIVLAVIGLIMVFAGLWMKFEGFRNFWTATWDVVWGAIKFVWNWIKENWPLLLAIITGPIGLAVLAITKNWDKIKEGASAVWKWITDKFDALVGFFSGVGKRISKSVSGMWDGLKTSFRNALNWMIGKWNGFSLTLGGGSVLGMGIPSVTLNTPDIPYLASGGNITQAGMAMVGERGREAVYLPAGAQVRPLDGGPPPGYGRQEVVVKGEILLRGDGILIGLRERIAINGGNVQAVLGNNS